METSTPRFCPPLIFPIAKPCLDHTLESEFRFLRFLFYVTLFYVMFYVFKKLLVLPVITVIINIFFLLLLFYLSDIINDINFYLTNGLVS